MDKSIYIVLPAYNEEKNIEDVVIQWYKKINEFNEKSRLIINDSGSHDNTHQILLELQKKYKNILIISNTNRFHGPKLLSMYKYAINDGIDYVFQTDSDGQTNPDEFDDFLKLIDEYDIIMGKRVKRGDGWIRKFVEKVVCFLVKIYFGIDTPDANVPYRLMKTCILKKYINLIPDDYELPNIILTVFFLYFNEKVIYRRISFSARKKGKNSINIFKIIKIGLKSLRDFSYFKKILKEM